MASRSVDAQERDQERGEDSREVMPPKPGEGAGLGESCSGCLSGGGSSGYLLLPNELSHTVRLQIATLACLARGPAVWTELSEDSLFSSWHIGRGESARVRVLGDLVSGWLTHVTGRSALAVRWEASRDCGPGPSPSLRRGPFCTVAGSQQQAAPEN